MISLKTVPIRFILKVPNILKMKIKSFEKTLVNMTVNSLIRLDKSLRLRALTKQ